MSTESSRLSEGGGDVLFLTPEEENTTKPPKLDESSASAATGEEESEADTSKQSDQLKKSYGQAQISLHAGSEFDEPANTTLGSVDEPAVKLEGPVELKEESIPAATAAENEADDDDDDDEEEGEHKEEAIDPHIRLEDTARYAEFEAFANAADNLAYKSLVDENVLADIKYLFKNTRYFLIKSNNYENVNLAKQRGVWSTPRVNEIKLNKAYRECANVLLLFSVSESGRFQGVARLCSECIQDEELQVNWMLPPNLSARSLSGVFKIDWLTKNDLPFTRTQHLPNPWNENKPVKVGRDGQEIEPRCGEFVCRMFDLNDASIVCYGESPNAAQQSVAELNEHLRSILAKSKQRHVELASEAESRRNNHRHHHHATEHRSSRGSETERTSRSKSSSADKELAPGEERDGAENDAADKSSPSQRKSSPDDETSATASLQTQPIALPNSNYQSNYRYRKDYQQPYSSFSRNRKRNYFYDEAARTDNFNHPHFQHAEYQKNAYAPYPQQPHSYPQYPEQVHHHHQQQQPQPVHLGHPQAPTIPHPALESNHRSSSSHRRHRNRSSSPKKRRISPKYLPVPKDIVLNSTYEEYVAAVAAGLHNPESLAYREQQSTAYHASSYPYDSNRQYANYEQRGYQTSTRDYGAGQYGYPVGEQDPNFSKYEQDVEEFLRRTTAQSHSTSERYKEGKEESSGRRRRSQSREGKSEKDRDRHHRRHRHRRHGSNSRERSSKRRSKDRK